MIPASKVVIGQEEVQAVNQVLASGQLSQGAQVAAFEQEFSSEAVDGAACIAVNSGTSALHLMLLAAGIGPGDEVIVPSFTFAATANAVALTGARPVFVDVDEDSFCMDPESARQAITTRTRAVLPVHLYGHPADLTVLTVICQEHGLELFEDAAQAHLSKLNGRPVGTWGTAAAFSFYPTKNMTSGEGGMIVTSDSMIERKCRLLRNQGQERRYENEIVGLNNRMTDINAAIGRVQLRKLELWTDQRQANARFYSEVLRGVQAPRIAEGAEHVFHQYTIRVEGSNRDALVEEMANRGVGTGVYYPIPVHRLTPFDEVTVLPVTERLCQEVVSLPVYPSLTQQERELVAGTLNDLVNAGG